MYTGEKYDVQNLKDKIGSTMIVPFFHPTKPLFWYVWDDSSGKRVYYAYDARTGKRELYDQEVIDSLVRDMFPGQECSVYYSPEFEGDELLA